MVKSKKLLQSRVLEFYNNITKRFKVEDKFFSISLIGFYF